MQASSLGKRTTTQANLPERNASGESLLEITPLGAGNEVGRSCILLKYKGKTVLLDCGIHPAYSGIASLPYFDIIDDFSAIDLLLVSHFHLDHAAALPYFLQKTSFKGRVFMTHPTKAIYKMLLTDFIKISNVATEDMLYTETDVNKSMDKIEQIDYHQEMSVNGIRFSCYNAGHVLGAAMFSIEIGGVRILYTGDFSRQEDRHLMEAETPAQLPDILIVESTYGVQIHEPRKEREARFTGIVQKTVMRGGRCLIPVFALGRAQELLLILDEYWRANPELKEIPIYFASSLGKKCMTVFQTFMNMMNERIQRQAAVANPFQFEFIKSLKTMDDFHDRGPCVVMASPGMLQSGLSRQLFEMWAEDSRNSVVLAGYSVEGTLAKQIQSEPATVPTLDGRTLQFKMSVHYISFSAHSDYLQTSDFIHILKPPNVVLVHGDKNEMSRLRGALVDKYQNQGISVFTPKNCVTVQMAFKAEKMCRVIGTIADQYQSLVLQSEAQAQRLAAHNEATAIKTEPETKSDGNGEEEEKMQVEKDLAPIDTTIQGVLIVKDFERTLVDAKDLFQLTHLPTTTISQQMKVPCSVKFTVLRAQLQQVYDEVKEVLKNDKPALCIFGAVFVIANTPKDVLLDWSSTPTNDIIADSVVALISHCETNPFAYQLVADGQSGVDAQFNRLADLLATQFGTVEKDQERKVLTIVVDDHRATFDFTTKTLNCSNDPLRIRLSSILTNGHIALTPLTDTRPSFA